MATKKTKYVCNECGYVSPQWLGKCPNCNKFGTLIEEIEENVTSLNKNQKRTGFVRPVCVNAVQKEKTVRIKSGIDEFDTVLGGGIVPYSMVLIGGDPGIGKSTLLTQVAINLAKNNKVLYVSAEESCSQLKMRCDRINSQADFMAINENCIENVLSVAEDYDFLIIDSIQAVYTENLTSSMGSVAQVKECASTLMRFAKSKQVTVFIIGHVTKEGTIAGPKVLEHIMDTVLYFEGETLNNCKILRAVKNRFGPSQEIGVFEMRDNGIYGVKDYDGIFISEEIGKNAGSIITPSISGNRCMLVELQCLLSKTVFGLPRRMPLGVDYNKLILMIAVLEKRAYIPLYNQDVYLNAMGGIKLAEPSVDLAIICSIASAFKEKAIPKNTAIFGEIGLTGEIRSVAQADKRINECVKRGIKKVILPYSNAKNLTAFKDKIELVGVKHVYEAIKTLFD